MHRLERFKEFEANLSHKFKRVLDGHGQPFATEEIEEMFEEAMVAIRSAYDAGYSDAC